jgi:2-isopropylmalate synthase
MDASRYVLEVPAPRPTARRWPDAAPRRPLWCSVDLRDGNQALPDPMGVAAKLRLFDALVGMGFREIEAGFPAASQTDFDFVRALVEEDRVPDGVRIQVLCQMRPDLMARTEAALRGARAAVLHIYNSTSRLQRQVVFGHDREANIAMAEEGARMAMAVRDRLEAAGGDVVLQYSPESLTGTEPEHALAACAAVLDLWRPTPDRKAIINLPSTVEHHLPNEFADLVEWMGERLPRRDAVVLSVHPHNDRGTAVAAAEMAVLAGAERVEGTLFGNGERTGNVCLLTCAGNLLVRGIDPGLDLSRLPALVEAYEGATGMSVHPRHPYAGTLVHTAFSGSHQDAIHKGLEAQARRNDGRWAVPYLPVDPADLGLSYEAVIRVNSQSGKGGIAWVLKTDRGLDLPKAFQAAFARHVQAWTDREGREIRPDEIGGLFDACHRSRTPWSLLDHGLLPGGARGRRRLWATLRGPGGIETLEGEGTGPIDALVDALARRSGRRLEVVAFHEHALARGTDAEAAAYVGLRAGDREAWGAGVDRDVLEAGLQATVAALNALFSGEGI